ncbi:MAG: hypothetical protein M1814_003090 [Vezdaea aestivalis]|nr:MAG: hypothetical protein M1814_003090 [Vezdaea aestivalis]
MASNAVNRPTNVKQKEADVNQKLQLYGIYSAFANGKVPSNKQIDVAMNSALASKPLATPSKRLSPEGQKLISDLRSVVEQAKILLLTKNQGNLLQDFIWHSEQLSGGSATVPGAPIDKETAQKHGNDALDGLRTLGTLLISNGQFRKLLSDATILVRSMAGDAATTAAGRVNPSEAQLSQLDQAAEDNTWHDTPNLSKEHWKNQAKAAYDKNKPFNKGDAKVAANDAAKSADPAGTQDPAAADGQAGANAAASTLQDRASANVPEETKAKGREAQAKGREALDKSKNYLNGKMPEERREQTIWRLKKMIVEIQGHQDYQKAVETLLTLAETYAGHGKNLAGQSKGTVKGALSENQAMLTDLKTLIERFANSTSLDDLFDSLNTIYRDAEKDPELKAWFKSIDAYIRKCLKEQGYIMQDSATQEWNALYDKGQYLLRDRYRTHTNRIVDEAKFIADQFDADAQNKSFALSLEKLFNDLGNDENGKPAFKPHLIKDLSNVILPSLFESVSYVPIPRIEFSDPTMDVIVENLVIESDNLMPNVFEIASDNYFRWGRKKIGNKNKNKIELSISGVQMDLKDVSYYVKKKQGFPSITDTGLADIYMGGQGFSFKIKMSTAESKDRAHFFQVDKVDVDVKHLNIKLKKSKYKVLYSLFKPMLFRVVRPAIQKVLEKQIKDSVAQADAIAYKIHQEAQNAIEEAKKNPENAQNIYQTYYQTAQKQFLQGKKKVEKTQEQAKNTKVNVAMTQHDSIFQSIKLPGGISTKATEYKDLAAKGDKWESPVFGIGSAKESTDLPKPSDITRKPHTTAAGPSGTGAATNGFKTEVSQAFDNNQDLRLRQGTGTTLGASNPVVNGTTGKETTLASDVRGALAA